MRGQAKAKAPRKTASCVIRLLNVLFSEHIYEQFCSSGNTLSRSELDSGAGGPRSFWDKVCDKYVDENDNNINIIQFEHPLLDDIELGPSRVFPHSPKKLEEMWKSVRSEYVKAMTNFTKSGNHQSSFTKSAILTLSGDASNNVDDQGNAAFEEDVDGMIDGGFCKFTNSIPVIYLRLWMNLRQGIDSFVMQEVPNEIRVDSEVSSQSVQSYNPPKKKS